MNKVSDLDFNENQVILTLENTGQIRADNCILAKENDLPGNPEFRNKPAFNSTNYFQNPWKIE